MIEIWHNPRCSKSRQTLALLEESGVTPTVKLYQTDPPTADEIRAVLALLGVSPAKIMRVKDGLFRDLGLSVDDDDTRLIDAMVAHPALIERPIVLANGKAALGRPPEAVLDIL
ncbi:arsenate reductase (glutaredoxin) [Aliiroseovarius sp. YM-037]|uniref:arsenate reductase (glutaredoxin) n=1 Tax=Aliiroseovarius sp. YM-037 TaxID=3341728 RepID=UPI003A80D7E9